MFYKTLLFLYFLLLLTSSKPRASRISCAFLTVKWLEGSPCWLGLRGEEEQSVSEQKLQAFRGLPLNLEFCSSPSAGLTSAVALSIYSFRPPGSSTLPHYGPALPPPLPPPCTQSRCMRGVGGGWKFVFSAAFGSFNPASQKH